MSGSQYQIIPGSDGNQETYRFTVLDANVVKDIERLYRVGLEGIQDRDTLSRLRGFIRRRDKWGEIFPGVGALELAQPLTSAFDASKFASYLVAVHSLARLTPHERYRVFAEGVPVSEVRSQPRQEFDTSMGLVGGILPELLSDAAILTKAWLLSANDVDWKSSLSELEHFCNSEIRFAPGLAVSLAVSLVAGSGKVVQELREVFKAFGSKDTHVPSRSVMNAAFDLEFLKSLRRIPKISMVAAGEILTPACGVTGDNGLIKLGLILGYGDSPQFPGERGSSILMPTNRFPAERQPAVFETMQRINAGSATRRKTTQQLKNNERFTLFATSSFLDEHGDSRWKELANQLDASPATWWNRV